MNNKPEPDLAETLHGLGNGLMGCGCLMTVVFTLPIVIMLLLGMLL